MIEKWDTFSLHYSVATEILSILFCFTNTPNFSDLLSLSQNATLKNTFSDDSHTLLALGICATMLGKPIPQHYYCER